MTPARDAVAAALTREPYLFVSDLVRATGLPRAEVKAASAQLVAEAGVERSLSAADGWLREC